MTAKVTMLILSCDKFSDLWSGHVALLEQNWGDRNMKTYIVSDIQNEMKLPGVEVICAGENVEWSDRLRYALKFVDSEYVFVTLDDYYLIKRVNNQQMEELVSLMDRANVDYIRLFPRPKRASKEVFQSIKKIRRVDTSCDYSVNLYSGFWKKAFLESCIRTPQNAWRFEVSLHKRAMEYNATCLVSARGEFKILDVVRKGKLLRKASRYFKKHPGLYEGSRETNTLSYETKLTIQQMVSRHVPRKVQRWLKAVLTKRGMQFYSDQADE